LWGGVVGSTHIVVLAVANDSQLAIQLVRALHKRGFTVISNRAAGGSDDAWDFVYDAAGVVLACQLPDVAGWASIPHGLERVVPVVLAANTRLPPEYAHLEPMDLSGHVDAGYEFEELVRRLNGLVADSRQRSSFDAVRSVDYALPLADGGAAVSSPLYAVNELEKLTTGVQRIGEILASDDQRTRLVRATLNEIGTSYRVVLDSIDEFYAVGGGSDPPDKAALAKLRGGRLAERIHNGRGHCKRIGARYFAEGGLRQALEPQVSAQTLEASDGTFRSLTNADMDLFDAMDMVGLSLTREARQLYALVLAGQQDEASRRLVRAHETLTPLEEALHKALRRFQDVEQALGYAQESLQEGKVVEDHSINIYGPVTNSVVAGTIRDSRIRLQSSTLPEGLEESMQELLAAVETMSGQLTPDDAEAAASELDQLTKEVTSEQPKAGIIKKCLRSLELFGRSVTDAGLPVVELVAKIAAFF
jgi:hypothetical protein